MRFSAYSGMDIGRDNGGVVDLSYADRRPFAFTGTIKKVVFDIKPYPKAKDEKAVHTVAHHAHAAHGLSS
jgi:arylsulfatase